MTLASLRLHLPIKGLVKATVFRQFCGGSGRMYLQIARLSEGRVGAILDYSI